MADENYGTGIGELDEYGNPYTPDAYEDEVDDEGGTGIGELDEFGNLISDAKSGQSSGGEDEESFSTTREMGVQAGMSINRGLLGISEGVRSGLTAKSEGEAKATAPKWQQSFEKYLNENDPEGKIQRPTYTGLSEEQAAEVNNQFLRKAATDGLKWLSGKFRQNMEYYEQSQDPHYLEVAQRIGEAEDAADGSLDKFTAGMKAVVQNPELIMPMAGGVVGTAALQLVGGRLANKAGTRVGGAKFGAQVGAAGATAVGAADMGQMQADATFDEIMEREPAVWAASERYVSLVREHGYSEEDAKERLATELSEVARQDTAISSFIINRIPMINQVEDMLGGRAIREGREAMQTWGKRGLDFLKHAGGEAFTEGAEGYMANRIGNQVEQSFDPTQDMSEDVGRVGADVFMGFLFGGAMSTGRQTAEAFKYKPLEPPTQENGRVDFTQEQIDAMNRGVSELEGETQSDSATRDPDQSDADTNDSATDDTTGDPDALADPDVLDIDNAEVVEESELQPTPDAEPEVYENLYDDEDGNTYALDEDGEYLLDDEGEYIITDADGLRTNGPEAEAEAVPAPEPEAPRTPQERVEQQFGPTPEQRQNMTEDETELARLELAMKLSTQSAEDLFAQKYGERPVIPPLETAPIEQRRAVRRDIEKQQARIEKRTGDNATQQQEFHDALKSRRTLPIEGQRLLRREIDRLRPRVQEQQESDAYLKRMEDIAELQDGLTIEHNIEQGSESDIAGRESLETSDVNTQNNRTEQQINEDFYNRLKALSASLPDIDHNVSDTTTDTTNSATAESQPATSPIESTTEGNQNEEGHANGPARDSVEGDARIDQDQRQQENDSVSSRPSQTGRQDSVENGNLEQANPDAEYGQDGQSESRREAQLDPEANAGRGQALRDQPLSDSVVAAAEITERRFRDSADRIAQKSNGRVQLFEDVEQLDPEQQAEYTKRAGDNRKIPAFYDPVTDKIYVNPKLVKTVQDLNGVVAHEAIHAGLRNEYGSENAIQKAMMDLLNDQADRDFIVAAAKKHGISLADYADNPNAEYTMGDLAAIMEEVIANTAQKRAQNGKVHKLITALRDFLGRMGVSIPYIGRGQSEMAVIRVMKNAQRAYNNAVDSTPYNPTHADRIRNAIPEADQTRIIGNITRRHEASVAEQQENAAALRDLIDQKLSGKIKKQMAERNERRLQYLISPPALYANWKHSLMLERLKLSWKKSIRVKQIVGDFTYNMRTNTESAKAADVQIREDMIKALNKQLKSMKLNPADSIIVNRMITARLTDSISTVINPKLQEAATLIRSAEVTAENANAYLFKGKKIPAELQPAFRQLMDTQAHSTAELATAHAFVTGKVDPQLPTSLIEPLENMRMHIDQMSAKILVDLNVRIADAESALSNESWTKLQDYLSIQGVDGHGQLDFADFSEIGDIPASLVSLYNARDTLTGNMGKYMHRSYQAFEDPDFYDMTKRDKRKMARLTALLKEQSIKDFRDGLTADQIKDMDLYLASGGKTQEQTLQDWKDANPGYTKIPDNVKVKGKLPRGYEKHRKSIQDGKLETRILTMLQQAKDSGGMLNLMTDGAKYGSKDLSVMRKRKDLPPIIREILGEYNDPRVNFIKSSAKMSNLIAKQAFLNGLKQKLEGSMLFQYDDIPDGSDFHAKVAGKNSDSMNPLNGMYSTQEFRDVLESWTEPVQMGAFMRNYMWFNGQVKIGKTVYNTGTHVANAGSNVLIGLVNGTLRPKHLMMATRLAGADMFGDNAYGRFFAGKNSSVEQMQELKVELIRRGVLSDGVNSAEVQAMMDDAKSSRQMFGDYLADSKLGRGLGTVDNIVKRTYQWEDDFFKAAAFFAETKDYMKQGMDQESAKIHAAQRVRDLWPTYSEIPPLVQGIRRFPLVGSFVSFSSEMIRTTLNQGHYMKEDWQHNKTKFAHRLVGMMVGGMGMVGLAALSKAHYGIDEEDDEIFRQTLPPWSTNGTILYLGVNEDGGYEYIDLSRFDPWSHFRKMWTSGYRSTIRDNNKSWGQRAVEFAIAAGEPFFAPEILAGALADVSANQKYGILGFPIYNTEKQGWDQVKETNAYIYNALAPGFMLQAGRFKKALDGDVSFSGKQFRVKDEMMATVGFRKGTNNMAMSMSRQADVLRQKITLSNKIVSEQIWDQSAKTKDDLKTAFDKMMFARERNYKNIISTIDLFRKQGLTDDQIYDMMLMARLSKRDTRDLMDGEMPEYGISDALGEKPLAKATVNAGNNKTLIRQLEDRFDFKKETIRDLTDDYYRNR